MLTCPRSPDRSEICHKTFLQHPDDFTPRLNIPMTPILATDLDGTLIPVTPMPPTDNAESEYRANESSGAATSDSALAERAALATFRRLSDAGKIEIIFVTGRHPSSVIGVMRDEGLPSPQWIICDVGTTILRRVSDQPYHPIEAYVNHLDSIIGEFTTAYLRSKIIQHADLSPQEDEKQGRHKLSYYCEAAKLSEHVARIDSQIDQLGAPYRTIGSVDPFNGDGLIDLLPRGTDKSSALDWWANQRVAAKEQIVFAGDSGNDFAALTSGFRAILVGNADRELAARVVEHHQQHGTPDRIYIATGRATAGVLEGCIEYGIVSQSASEQS
ncbi:MAG TPA: hypothetical protein DDZ51_07795 [Planctomycetaceae bacterium]|nr:hypothetical protein [Planctomycetaceae bacterium]